MSWLCSYCSSRSAANPMSLQRFAGTQSQLSVHFWDILLQSPRNSVDGHRSSVLNMVLCAEVVTAGRMPTVWKMACQSVAFEAGSKLDLQIDNALTIWALWSRQPILICGDWYSRLVIDSLHLLVGARSLNPSASWQTRGRLIRRIRGAPAAESRRWCPNKIRPVAASRWISVRFGQLVFAGPPCSTS